MKEHPLHAPTTRVALAAYLHDLGKLAERTAVYAGDARLDAHLTLYCPFHKEGGWHSHRHAAHTALAFDTIEPWLPRVLTGESSPFVGRRYATDPSNHDQDALEATDSLVNAAAAHHKPDTFLQWIIATADRVASGFEREEFETYNHGKDETRSGLDHYSARQITLFEQIRLDGSEPAENALQWRYPLKPLSPASLFPQKADQCESRDRKASQAEYAKVWSWFLRGMEDIPAAHRQQASLWFDHFDSLWMTATHAIPAATAFNVKPEVSLYDHSRTAAALAAALWRWHEAAGQTDAAAAQRLRERRDFGEQKFLLIQGDFFGIQDFIFASGGDSRKHAAKLLRGRSFQVSLFTEVAALRILEALGLPATSQVINAAGKFLIVAPHTPEVITVLHELRGEFDAWFLKHTFGLAGMGLAWEAASCNDFLLTHKSSPTTERGFAALRTRLVAQLDRAKHARFDLCRQGAQVFAQADYRDGPCAYNGRLPADRLADRAARGDNNKPSCALSRDQIAIGTALVKRFERLLIVRNTGAAQLFNGGNLQQLELPLFGYQLAFTAHEDASGRFGELATSGQLRRCFDFSLPSADDTQGCAPLWHGYARRFISGYVPRASGHEHGVHGRFIGVAQDDFPEAGDLLPFDLLASEDRQANAQDGHWQGIAALGVLKGDIDNLGELFRVGLQKPTFAKHAALSRQVNSFFAIYLPWLLAREFPKVYTVFAGGDDFFLIGPWRTVQRLAWRMRCEFHRYVAENANLHFSAGIATQKPGAPVHVLAELAEDALEQAKKCIEPDGSKAEPAKNAVTCFGQTVSWTQWPHLEGSLERLNTLKADMELSTAYVYGLLQFVDMREQEVAGEPEAAMWRARFKYRTRRFVVDRIRGLDEATRQRHFTTLAIDIGDKGINQLGASYRVALFNHLYQFRDR
jgi:CRISPR-associated protein Csm1